MGEVSCKWNIGKLGLFQVTECIDWERKFNRSSMIKKWRHLARKSATYSSVPIANFPDWIRGRFWHLYSDWLRLLGQEKDACEAPENIGNTRNKESPGPGDVAKQDYRGDYGGHYVPHILVTRPTAEYVSSILRTKPVTHNNSVDRSACWLHQPVKSPHALWWRYVNIDQMFGDVTFNQIVQWANLQKTYEKEQVGSTEIHRYKICPESNCQE